MLRYALNNNGEKIEPQKGLKGLCPHCHAEVISKCGVVKVHHWAHKNAEMCDKWWENKTEWHRIWQDKFPKEWQEVRVDSKDETQWHIADICTPDGLVVEFQHSKIEEIEQKERENFYLNNKKGVVWVVDVSGKRAIKILDVIPADVLNGKRHGGWMVLLHSSMAFPKQWRDSKNFVFYDVQCEDKRYLLHVVRSSQFKFLFGIPFEDFLLAVTSCKNFSVLEKNCVQRSIEEWILEHRPVPLYRTNRMRL